LLLPVVAIAQSSGGSFEITRSSVDPAATALSGGAFTLTATVGQPATAPVSAGSFELTGGFNAVGPSDVIFANGFEP
jgi:hypothetical protein